MILTSAIAMCICKWHLC